jgi:hypothetical protein
LSAKKVSYGYELFMYMPYFHSEVLTRTSQVVKLLSLAFCWPDTACKMRRAPLGQILPCCMQNGLGQLMTMLHACHMTKPVFAMPAH